MKILGCVFYLFDCFPLRIRMMKKALMFLAFVLDIEAFILDIYNW